MYTGVEKILQKKKKVRVDYKKSLENYKKYIFEYFQQKGYNIDVYLSTNELKQDDKNELCEDYKPIKCNYIEFIDKDRLSKNSKLKNVIELCIEQNIKYDLVLITRFDLLFQKDFNTSNIKFDKFNLVSVLEQPHGICDNFYLFPYKYLESFLKIVNNNLNKSMHPIRKDIENINGKDFVNYILNNNTSIDRLEFYKIVRTYV
jgi:hypothetical protein